MTILVDNSGKKNPLAQGKDDKREETESQGFRGRGKVECKKKKKKLIEKKGGENRHPRRREPHSFVSEEAQEASVRRSQRAGEEGEEN